MQKTQTNWVFLTWSLCFITLFFVTIVLWFLFSLFLGFALHYIHAFYSRLFFILFKLKKEEEKRKQIMFLHLFSWHWKQGWLIYLHITCLCTLFSSDELIYCTLLVKLCSACCVGKIFIVFNHFVLILKSHVFVCRTWTFGERHK